ARGPGLAWSIPSPCGRRDTTTEMDGGGPIAIGDGRTRSRLRHGTEMAAEAVRFVAGYLESRVGWWEAEPDPYHPVLCRKDGKLREGPELVAARRGRVSEPSRKLVAPALKGPDRTGRVHEGFERRRCAPHVRRATEHDGIRPGEHAVDGGTVIDRD